MSGVLAAVGSFLSTTLDINQATLSGALDVIAVRYDDGSVKATPFHVRFGKIKLLRSKGKRVKVFVNGADSGLVMSLGSAGEAYFAPTDGIEGLDALSHPDAEPEPDFPMQQQRRDSVSSSASGSSFDPAALANLPSLEVDGTVTVRGVAVGTLQTWGARMRTPDTSMSAKVGSPPLRAQSPRSGSALGPSPGRSASAVFGTVAAPTPSPLRDGSSGDVAAGASRPLAAAAHGEPAKQKGRSSPPSATGALPAEAVGASLTAAALIAPVVTAPRALPFSRRASRRRLLQRDATRSPMAQAAPPASMRNDGCEDSATASDSELLCRVRAPTTLALLNLPGPPVVGARRSDSAFLPLPPGSATPLDAKGRSDALSRFALQRGAHVALDAVVSDDFVSGLSPAQAVDMPDILAGASPDYSAARAIQPSTSFVSANSSEPCCSERAVSPTILQRDSQRHQPRVLPAEHSRRRRSLDGATDASRRPRGRDRKWVRVLASTLPFAAVQDASAVPPPVAQSDSRRAQTPLTASAPQTLPARTGAPLSAGTHAAPAAGAAKKPVTVPHRGRLGGMLNFLLPSRSYERDDSDDSSDDVSDRLIAVATARPPPRQSAQGADDRDGIVDGRLTASSAGAIAPVISALVASAASAPVAPPAPLHPRARSADFFNFAVSVVASADAPAQASRTTGIPALVVPSWHSAWQASKRRSSDPRSISSDGGSRAVISLVDPVGPKASLGSDTAAPVAVPAIAPSKSSYSWLRSFISRPASTLARADTPAPAATPHRVLKPESFHAGEPHAVAVALSPALCTQFPGGAKASGLAGALPRSNWFLTAPQDSVAPAVSSEVPLPCVAGRVRPGHRSRSLLRWRNDEGHLSSSVPVGVLSGDSTSSTIGRQTIPRRSSVPARTTRLRTEDRDSAAPLRRLEASTPLQLPAARMVSSKAPEIAVEPVDPVPRSSVAPLQFSIEGLDAAAHLVSAKTAFADVLNSTLLRLSARRREGSLRRSLSTPRRASTETAQARISVESLRAQTSSRSTTVMRALRPSHVSRNFSRRARSLEPQVLALSTRDLCSQAFRLWSAAADAAATPASDRPASLHADNAAPSADVPKSHGRRILGWIPVVGSLLAPAAPVRPVAATAPSVTTTTGIERPASSQTNRATPPAPPAAESSSGAVRGRQRASTASGAIGEREGVVAPDDNADSVSVLSGDVAGGYDTDGSSVLSELARHPRTERPGSAISRKAGEVQRGRRPRLVPTEDQLRAMPLILGPNHLEFVVEADTSVRVSSTLYLWTPSVKIVVSDVDGTITKSDVLGHLAYMVGRDWTHAGVAQLFSSIRSNGYQFMYLTSRAIGQSDSTKEYLTHIKQGAVKIESDDAPSASHPGGGASVGGAAAAPRAGKPPPAQPKGSASAASAAAVLPRSGAAGNSATAAAPGPVVPIHRDAEPIFHLPAGPVFTSPDRLVTAFTREVIHRRPQEFKIPSLVSVLELFPPGSHPFYAGFGNRGTDVQAYQSVGIPNSKIFVINPSGEVRLASSAAAAPARSSPLLAAAPVGSSSSPARLSLAGTPDNASSSKPAPHHSASLASSAVPAAASQTYCKSYPSLTTLVSAMFPFVAELPITAPRVGSQYGIPVALDEHYGDVTFWRRPMPVLSDSDVAAATAKVAPASKPGASAKPLSGAGQSPALTGIAGPGRRSSTAGPGIVAGLPVVGPAVKHPGAGTPPVLPVN